MRFNVFREPISEFVVGVKESGHYEVKKSPELAHSILNGSTGEKKAITTLERQQETPTQTRKIDKT